MGVRRARPRTLIVSESGCGELAIVPVGIRDNHALSACAAQRRARRGMEARGWRGRAAPAQGCGALMSTLRCVLHDLSLVTVGLKDPMLHTLHSNNAVAVV